MADQQETVTTEGSNLGRFVALFTPILAIGAGWLAGVVAKHTGAKLDQGQIVAFMAAALTAVLASGLKWMHGWQQHERLVVENRAQPLKPAPPATSAAPEPNPAPVLSPAAATGLGTA
jgi:hypothetical protein